MKTEKLFELITKEWLEEKDLVAVPRRETIDFETFIEYIKLKTKKDYSFLSESEEEKLQTYEIILKETAYRSYL